jgi:hypothetical protein
VAGTYRTGNDPPRPTKKSIFLPSERLPDHQKGLRSRRLAPEKVNNMFKITNFCSYGNVQCFTYVKTFEDCRENFQNAAVTKASVS